MCAEAAGVSRRVIERLRVATRGAFEGSRSRCAKRVAIFDEKFELMTQQLASVIHIGTRRVQVTLHPRGAGRTSGSYEKPVNEVLATVRFLAGSLRFHWL